MLQGILHERELMKETIKNEDEPIEEQEKSTQLETIVEQPSKPKQKSLMFGPA